MEEAATRLEDEAPGIEWTTMEEEANVDPEKKSSWAEKNSKEGIAELRKVGLKVGPDLT